MCLLPNKQLVCSYCHAGELDPLAERARRQRDDLGAFASGPWVGQRHRQRAATGARPVACRRQRHCRAPGAVALDREGTTRDPDRHRGMRATAGEAEAGRIAAMDQARRWCGNRALRSDSRCEAQKEADSPRCGPDPSGSNHHCRIRPLAALRYGPFDVGRARCGSAYVKRPMSRGCYYRLAYS